MNVRALRNLQATIATLTAERDAARAEVARLEDLIVAMTEGAAAYAEMDDHPSAQRSTNADVALNAERAVCVEGRAIQERRKAK